MIIIPNKIKEVLFRIVHRYYPSIVNICTFSLLCGVFVHFENLKWNHVEHMFVDFFLVPLTKINFPKK